MPKPKATKHVHAGRLQEALDREGLNENQLASRIGGGYNHVKQWKETSCPGGDKLIEMSKILKEHPAWILGEPAEEVLAMLIQEVRSRVGEDAADLLALLARAQEPQRGRIAAYVRGQLDAQVPGSDTRTVTSPEVAQQVATVRDRAREPRTPRTSERPKPKH